MKIINKPIDFIFQMAYNVYIRYKRELVLWKKLLITI